MCKIVLTNDTTYDLIHYLCIRKKKQKPINLKLKHMKKILLIAVMAMLTTASFAHKRIVNATPISNDTIYYNVENMRVDSKDVAAYGRLLLTEGTGREKRDVFRDFYPNGNVKIEGGYSFIDLSDDKNTRYEGDVTAFYPNGKEKWHGTFVNGKPNGYFTMMMRDGSIATAQFINGKSRLNYFVVPSPDGTMSRRDIKELESFLKIK